MGLIFKLGVSAFCVKWYIFVVFGNCTVDWVVNGKGIWPAKMFASYSQRFYWNK